MKQTHLLFLSVTLAVLFSSCRSAQQREFIAEAKKLDNKVKELTTVFNNLPTDSIRQIWNAVNLNIQYVNSHAGFIEDNASHFMKEFGPYASSGKILSRVIKKRMPIIKEQLEYTNTQVDNLLHDLRKGYLQDPDSAQLYLTREKNETMQLESQIMELNNTIKQQRRMYDSSRVKVEEMINESRKKIN
jgi:hypothetical protein